MKDRTATPPPPLVPQGDLLRGIRGETTAPSPDKGRGGEGLGAGGLGRAERLKCLRYDKRLTALARENRRNPTPAENLLWNNVLRGKQFERYKFLRQKPIGEYIVDFYCADLRLVIEIDGDSHAEQVDYDAERSRFLNSLGLHVVRYSNRDVLGNLPGLYDDLLTLIASSIHDH